MAVLMVIINIVSVIANWSGDLQVGAVVSLVAAIWAWGIFSNYKGDPLSAPNYAVGLSVLSGLAGFILAVIGFVG